MSKSCFLSSLMWTALVLFGTSACSRQGVDTTEVIRPVRVVALQSAEATARESFAGQVEARHQAKLSFQVGGQLVSRLVDTGDRVKKGQVLAKINPQDLGLALQAAQAQADAATLEHKHLAIDLDRAKTLKQQNFISQAELDRRQLALDAAASRLTQARAQLGVQANQRQYSELRAPGDGVVSQVYAEAGQVVPAGQPVLQWANEQAAQVRMAVPESRVAGIQPGQQASVQLWADQAPLKAVVRELSPVADPLTRTFAVILDLDSSADRTPRFGMSATVTFSKPQQGGTFSLPISALVAEPTGAFVWVFDEPKGQVNKRIVQPHDVSESSFLVKEGLKDGELIVTAGTHVLIEGQKVRRFIETSDLKQ